MTARRFQILLAVFFLLWIANCITSHALAHEFMQKASAPAPKPLEDAEIVHGQGLLFVNFPLFIGTGYMLKSEHGANPALYWSLVVLGSLYLPVIATLLVFFLVHAPQKGSSWPGVEIDDGSIEEEDDDD